MNFKTPKIVILGGGNVSRLTAYYCEDSWNLNHNDFSKPSFLFTSTKLAVANKNKREKDKGLYEPDWTRMS